MARIPVPQRRAALIGAALRVIARQGVASATTRAIAAEAQMSLASLHYAFESRDDLIAAVIAHVLEQQATAALETLTPGSDLETTLRNGLRAFVAVIAADPQREQALFELTQYALRTPGLGLMARREYASYYATAELLLATAAEATGYEWDRPLAHMARILVTFTDGISIAWLVDRDTDATLHVIDFAASALAKLARRVDHVAA